MQRSRHAIGVGNGTDAIWLALLALGIGAGDEVITVPNSFMATAEAITYCKARPVFVDVDENTFTMNPAELKKVLTPRTKAIIPVHLFGQPADMDPILDFARAHGSLSLRMQLRLMAPSTRVGKRARWAMRAVLAFIREESWRIW